MSSPCVGCQYYYEKAMHDCGVRFFNNRPLPCNDCPRTTAIKASDSVEYKKEMTTKKEAAR